MAEASGTEVFRGRDDIGPAAQAAMQRGEEEAADAGPDTVAEAVMRHLKEVGVDIPFDQLRAFYRARASE